MTAIHLHRMKQVGLLVTFRPDWGWAGERTTILKIRKVGIPVVTLRNFKGFCGRMDHKCSGREVRRERRGRRRRRQGRAEEGEEQPLSFSLYSSSSLSPPPAWEWIQRNYWECRRIKGLKVFHTVTWNPTPSVIYLLFLPTFTCQLTKWNAVAFLSLGSYISSLIS